MVVGTDTLLEPPPPPRADNGKVVVFVVVVGLVVVVVMPCHCRLSVALSATVEVAVLDIVVLLRACVDDNKTREQTTIDTMNLFGE